MSASDVLAGLNAMVGAGSGSRSWGTWLNPHEPQIVSVVFGAHANDARLPEPVLGTACRPAERPCRPQGAAGPQRRRAAVESSSACRMQHALDPDGLFKPGEVGSRAPA